MAMDAIKMRTEVLAHCLHSLKTLLLSWTGWRTSKEVIAVRATCSGFASVAACFGRMQRRGPR